MWLESAVLFCALYAATEAGLGAKAGKFLETYDVDKEESDHCRIRIPHKTSQACRLQRNTQLEMGRKIFKLKQASMPLPGLDMNHTQLMQLLFKDELNHDWVILYPAMIQRTLTLARNFMSETRGVRLTSADDYENVVFRYFVERVKAKVPPVYQKYFKYPFQDPNVAFRNLTHFCSWREDEVFTDLRLAGLNPMAIRQVSMNTKGSVGVPWSDVWASLNSTFDWEGSVQDALGLDLDLKQAIQRGYVYVVRYPLFDNLLTQEDPDPRRTMPSFSPIAIFVSKPSRRPGKANRLVPVAIQMDAFNDADVYTPQDGDLWLLAKQALHVADYANAQVVEHLFKTHTLMEPVCVCVQRQLSTFHPLHHMLQFHCRGLFGTNKIGRRLLLTPVNGTIDKLLPIGAKGAMELIKRAHEAVTWKDTDFRQNIKGKRSLKQFETVRLNLQKRGLKSQVLLPYFPYRDDGQLIYAAIEDMVSEYINLYYKTNADVQRDVELQQFAKDVSPYGQGQVKDFPSRIEGKKKLKQIVSRIIWQLSAQHTAVNYPVDYYGAITPIMPTKLYEDPSARFGEFGVSNLGGRYIAAAQVSLAMSLSSFRYDSLFDYGDHLLEPEAQRIVKKHHEYLNGHVTSVIQERNRQRLADQRLAYPYLLPAWITNSIHT